MNMPLSRVRPDAQTATNLEEWEAEGGAPKATAVRTADSDPAALSEAEQQLLQRLGAALVSEWNQLPTPWQRTLYARAVGTEPPWTVGRTPPASARASSLFSSSAASIWSTPRYPA